MGHGPDGTDTCWFLECGPNAQWVWIAHHTGLSMNQVDGVQHVVVTAGMGVPTSGLVLVPAG